MRSTLTAVLAAAAFATLPGAPADATPPDYADYVALGDSFAAGPLVPTQNIAAATCLQSVDNGYPAQLAATLGVRNFRNASCSGAKAQDFDKSGPGWGRGATPQYDALTADTDLVTLTIGANDAGLFQDLLGCLNPVPGNTTRDCVDRFTTGGTDQLAAKVDASAAHIGGTLAEIARRAPHARIVITSYGKYLRPGGCTDLTTPIGPRDADYLQATIDRLGDRIAEQATAHGATFVDLRPASLGHDACAAPADRWIEPLLPAAAAAPFHPNALGGQAFAALIAAAL
ncbi:SGNH/GDSL hydrolase family protein [Nocardia huaxiensis]|uniref:SGNH/GDSL hydrolase family protein n=1 Tax=Nocardia huaxiensis TaxID=2755382 RepID=A0A7D6V7C0_9NOCA|nr:SGNH/GDSL hydrolase family protein [Nocardia huaxiensis]QLY29412.1 SGNH/GDSL hydrolase family protein [Nocardia huaxiensis]UFS97106.1 SGNH/GDSL hydrolase family protein [Nocardia huaxiensis]